MVSFFRRAPGRRASRRRAVSAWPNRRIRGELLEQRALLSANLSFAIAGANGNQALAVRTDAAGNVYELGNDAVYKFAPDGTQVWSTAYTASSQIYQKEGLALDASGNIYITGNFNNGATTPAKFGSTSLVAAGTRDGFIAKLDNNGNFLWAESFGGGTGNDNGYAIAMDAAGNAYITGDFNSTMTIGSGTNSQTLNGGQDSSIFVAKFDTSGTLQWVDDYVNGNAFGDHGYGIAVDGQGNAYVTGDFTGTMDFDPAAPNQHVLTTFFGTTFLLKLDTNGKWVWSEKLNANTVKGDGRAQGAAIAVDGQGNVYTTGIFGGPVDLNPAGGDLNTESDFVFPDAYVEKLTSAGAFVWAADLHDVSVTNPFGGLQPEDIAVDAAGNVDTTGAYQGVANFDPLGTQLKTSLGLQDIYISSLTNQGTFNWVATAGEAGFNDIGYGVAVTSAAGGADVYASGVFSNTVNFNSGTGPADNVTANGLWDGFLWGLNAFHNQIGGVVWNDANDDGIRQASELGLAGVPVSLFTGTPGSGTQVATTVTDSLGLYSFNGVSINQSYYVQVSLPAGDAFVAEGVGTDPTVNSGVSPATGDSSALTLSPGQSVIINAGVQETVAPPAFGIAFGVPTGNLTEGSSIVPDASGDFYVAGTFTGSVTFGTGSTAVTLVSGNSGDATNGYVAKYAPDGGLLWVTQIDTTVYAYAPKLRLDGFGDVYVAGGISGTTTIGSFTLNVPINGNTSFLAKLDSNGNALWATSLVPSTDPYNVGLAVDPVGDAYVVGGFTGTQSVNTSPATSLASAGGSDVFAVKVAPDGTIQWAQNYGGKSDDMADSAAIDPSGNLDMTGIFEGTASFGTTSLTSASSNGPNDFVAKINAANGSVIWAKALASSVSSGQILFNVVMPLNRIAVDSQGNIYTTGYFDGNLQLDPNNGTDLVNGTNAEFISKLDTNGNFILGKAISIGSTGFEVEGNGIAVDSAGNIYTTGNFAGTINFNPNTGPTQSLSTTGSSDNDVFVLELDKTGNFVNVQRFGGNATDQGTAISLDSFGNAYVTGSSTGPAVFSTVTIGAPGELDSFVLRLGNTFGALVNAAPSFAILGPPQSLPLNAPAQTVPGFLGNIVQGPPGEVNEVLSFQVTVSADNPNLFSVAPTIDSTGTLTYTPAPGQGGTATVTVIAHNNGGTANGGSDTSAAQQFTITVGVNHAPSFTPGNAQTVLENATGVQSVLHWATSLSPGPADEAGQALNFIVSYTITSLNGSTNVPAGSTALFSVAPAIDPTGKLTYTLAPNVWGTAEVSVELHDDGGTLFGGVDTSLPQTFAINVLFVNQAPSFKVGSDQSTNENSGPQTVLHWATQILPGPPSENGQKLTFIVSTNGDDSLFSSLPAIDPKTGNLTYTPANDASGTANITVTLMDDGGTANGGTNLSLSQTFAITVNFVNQPPIFTSGGNVTVDEDSGPQTINPWATKISPGAPQQIGQTLNFIVNDGGSKLFAAGPSIDPTTGVLTFTPATDMFGMADVTVELQNSGGGNDTSAPQTFTITVNFVNHAPSFNVGKDQTTLENAGTQVVTGWAKNISAGPPSEANEALNFTVNTDNPALFPTLPTIDPTSGDLTYTPAANESGVAHVNVTLYDDGGTANGGVDHSATQTFTINVTFVNQPPSFIEGRDQTVHETPGPQTVVGWATGISPGPSNQAAESLNFVVTYTITGFNGSTTVPPGAELFSVPPAIDPNTGTLTYTPAQYAVGTADVSIKLQNSGGTANNGRDTSAAQFFTINVTQSNQAPSFMPGQSLINEVGSFGLVTVPGWATSISAGPPAEALQTLNFIVADDNNALFQGQQGQPAIDPSTGNLTFTPAPGASGKADVTVELHDNGGTLNGGVDTSMPVTFQISVTYVNQVPIFKVGVDQAVNENAGLQTVAAWATKISAGSPAESWQSLNFIITTTNNALFSSLPAVDPTTGNLTYMPALDANGSAVVSVSLHDNGGTVNGGIDTSAVQQFKITVNPVNQKPFFTAGASLQVAENSGAQTFNGWATGISPGAANESSQILNFIVNTDNNALFAVAPAIDPTTGNLTFTPATDVDGTANLTVQLHDNGCTANGGVDTSVTEKFKIAVTFVNQPPTYTGGQAAVSNEQSIAVTAGGEVTLKWSAVTGATAYQIYRGTSPGQETELLQTVDGNTTTFVDPGVAGLPVSPPGSDASGLAAPTLSTPTASATGGQLVARTYYYEVAAYSAAQTLVNPPASNENAGPQTVAGWATDISTGAPNQAKETLRFAVSNDNPSLFSTQPQIDPATGNLTYTAAANASGTAHVLVLLQNSGGTANGGQDWSGEGTATITVNFVNRPPSFMIADNPPAVDENSGAQTVVGFATQISPSSVLPAPANQASQTVHFNVTLDDNPGLFAVAPAIDPSGTLTYTLNPYLSGSADITVDLQNNGGVANGGVDTSTTQKFTITENYVNQAPFFTSLGSSPVVVNEDSGTATIAGFAAVNPGIGDPVQAISYQVSVDNAALFDSTGLPAIDSSGTLTFTPGAHTVGVANVTAVAVDNGGTANGGVDQSQPVQFQIRINQINHPPTVANPLPAVVVNENAADLVFNNAVISQVFDDIDVDLHLGDQLSLSASIDATSLNPGLLTANLSSTDPASAALTLHFSPGQYGTAIVDFTATDKSGATVTDPISVTVNQANVPPSFSAGGNVPLSLNPGPQSIAGWATHLANGLGDPPGETLNFNVSVISTTNPNLFSVLPTVVADQDSSGNYTGTATLSFTPAANQAGTATIAVTLQNSGGTTHGGSDTSLPQTFQIVVAGVPTAVNHSYLVGANAAASIAAGSGVLVGAHDASGLPLTAELVSPPSNGNVQLNPDGSFTYTPAASFQTTDSFTFAVSNGVTLSNVATVTITSDQSAIIEKLYQQVLGRVPDAAGLAYWTQQVDNGQQYGAVAQGIFDSVERIGPIIANYYQQFLLRTADSAGLAFWEQVWQSAGGPEQVIAGMIASPEFYASAGAARTDLSPNAAWVTALYERLLNRAPDSGGLQYWTNNLDTGAMTLVDVVNGFEYSTENFQNLTTSFFQQYLGRAPTAIELADYVQQFQQGATDADIQAEIIDLPEYRNSLPPPVTGTLEFLS